MAGADVLVLANGGRLEGRVEETADGWLLRTETGAITFERGEVARVERGRTEAEEIREERAALAPGDAQGRARLAERAERTGAAGLAEELWRETVALAPDHEAARAALGYVRVEGRWLQGDEARAALGMVRRGAEWVSKAEIEAERAARETERAAAETEAALAEADAARAAAALAEAERALVERRLEAIERELRRRSAGWWLVPVCRPRLRAGGLHVPAGAATSGSRFVEPGAGARWVEPARDPTVPPDWAIESAGGR